MARIDNLTNFLTDVATSIRTKKGTTNKIAPKDFDTEIESIQSGGGTPNLQEAHNNADYNGKEIKLVLIYTKTTDQGTEV